MPSDVNEEMALLSRPARTPLPKLQLSVIMLIQICEPLASQSIYPYITASNGNLGNQTVPQLVSELDITGGDERKVGYYAYSEKQQLILLQESLFFLSESLTVLQWSRASDRIGRKPILIMGLFGTASSILLFGLSRTFGALVASRCLCGLLNGNVGVMKSAMGDLTDRSNRAEAFAYLPIVWAIGASVGPLIGGNLARPHHRFPESFAGQFWESFPYFLPCLVTGSVVFLSCFTVFAFFKETVPWKTKPREGGGDARSTHSLLEERTGPRPLRDLFIFPVIISVSNYVALWFLNTTLAALLPLFLAMPLEIGGLALSPPTIGLVLSAYGLATGLFQALFFARFVRRFGEKRVFMNGMMTCLPVFALFPLMSMIAQRAGISFVVWILLACVLALGALMDTAYGAIFMFVTASAPKSSRGSVNGLSQTLVALARSIGPALSTSLFSFSVQHNLLGGYFVYLVFFVLSGFALVLARRLPVQIWDDVDG